MAKSIRGRYFDGQSSASHDVILRLHGGGTISVDPTFFASISFDQVKIASRIGNVPRSIMLANGGRIETDNHDTIDYWLNHLKQRDSFAYTLESKASTALGALAFIVLFTIACIGWGIPSLSKILAHELPTNVSYYIAEGALDSMDQYLFDDSSIDIDRREDLIARFNALVPENAGGLKYQLLFRHSKVIGANALALPNGTVVITDELIELAEHDEEILAILLHEIGHVVHRHSLRQILDQTGIAVVTSVLLGDIGSGGSLVLGMPNVLLNSSYSRDMEWEADSYAFEQLQSLKISTQHFSNVMERMSSEYGETNKQTNFDFYDYFSTHPPTEDRISRFLDPEGEIKSATIKPVEKINIGTETKHPDIFAIRTLFKSENFEELDRVLKHYQNQYEREPGGEIALEMAYEALGLTDKSYEMLFKKWIRAMPDSYTPYLARGGYLYNYSWLKRGSNYIARTSDEQKAGMKSYQARASKDLEKVLELKPSAMLAYSHLIAIASSQSQDELKARYIINALTVDPASYLVRRDILIYSQPKWGGSYRQIKETLRETADYNDHNPELGALQGYLYHVKALKSYSDKKNYKVIKQEYQAISTGGKPWYYAKLADTYYRLNDFESAVIAYSNAIELNPNNERNYYWRGNAYWKLDKQDLAIEDMEYAVRLDPYYNRAQKYLGWFYAREKRHKKSLDAYKAALYHHPDDKDALFYVSDLLMTLKRHNEAKAPVKRLLQLEPENARYQYKLALILDALRDCEVVPAMEVYISLCNEEGTEGCFQEGIDWARNAAHILKKNHCKGH